MKWNPARLFSSSPFRPLDPTLRVYRSDEAALRAVRDRKKPICLYSMRASEVPEFQALAFDHGLAMTVVEERGRGWRRDDQPVIVFIAHPEELWRVPALLALHRTAFVDGAWSDAAENQESYLLGYTAKQREAWIAARRHDRPAWTCATVYAVLDRSRRAVVESVGRRCLGSTIEASGTVLFVHPNPLKASALSLVPAHHALARFGLRWPAYEKIFHPLKQTLRDLTAHTLTRKSVPIVHAGLTSNVQFLTRTGWR